MKRASLLDKNFIIELNECRLFIVCGSGMVFVLTSQCFVPVGFVDKSIIIFPVFLLAFAELLFAFVFYF